MKQQPGKATSRDVLHNSSWDFSKMQRHKKTKTKIKRLGETILDLKETSIVKQLFSNLKKKKTNDKQSITLDWILDFLKNL